MQPNAGKAERIEIQFEALKRVLSLYIEADEDDRAAFETMLAEIIRLTSSEYGFIGEVRKENGERYLKTFAITNISWNEETRKFYEEEAPMGLEFRNLDTLFGYCIREEKLVIANDAENDPRAGGIPKGHPPLISFLGIPLFAAGEILGMVGVANGRNGYAEGLVEEMDLLLKCTTQMISTAKQRREAVFGKTSLELLSSETGVGTWKWSFDDDDFELDEFSRKLLGLSEEKKYISRVDFERSFPKVTVFSRCLRRNFVENGKITPVQFATEQGNETKQLLMFGDIVQSRSYVAGCFLDITKTYEAERKSRLADEARSNFISNVTHELKTPLTNIIGAISLLRMQVDQSTKESAINVVSSNAEHLLELVEQTLEGTSGSRYLDHEEFSIREFVADLETFFSLQMKEKSISFSVKVEDDVQENIHSSKRGVRQIIINLIKNAWKFTDRGGSINVEVFSPPKDKGFLCVSVTDNGIGIAEGDIDRIFEPFVQADESTKRKFGGTGLGLSISKDLATELGSELHVESEPGKGSRFSLLFR